MVCKVQGTVESTSRLITEKFSNAIGNEAPQFMHLLNDSNPDVRRTVVNAMPLLAKNGVWVMRVSLSFLM
jgi:hypothetical protein